MNNQRFSEAPWLERKMITLIGVGGIGRGLVTPLLSLGHTVKIYDHDYVEEHNCLPQGFVPDHIGMEKVVAVGLQNSYFPNLFKSNSRWDNSKSLFTIVITAVDNMSTRKEAFDKWCEMDDRELFINPSMEAEFFSITICQKGQEDRFRETLFDDSEVDEGPCTFRQTPFTPYIIQGKIVSFLCNWISNIENPIKRPVPFRYTYNCITNKHELWER